MNNYHEEKIMEKTEEALKKQNYRGTETPQGIQKEPLLEKEVNYQEVEEKVNALLPNSSTALKVSLAVAASASFKNPVMLWLLLVGVPSSGKTDIVRLLKEAPTTYSLDNLTLNALISGERPTEKEKVHDLLPLLDQKCLIVKDWTSIFSLDEKMTKKILGDLVGCYDREFSKFSSRRGQISYKSEFSQLGCVTPATLNKHATYMNMVGPRFLCYTMPTKTVEEENSSFDNIFSDSDRPAIEREARLTASTYLNQLSKKEPTLKPLTKEVTNYLKIASQLMACARGIVLIQAANFLEDGKSTTYYEVLDIQIEEPWRAVQQLIALSRYLAFVVAKDEVGADELSLIKEIVISSMPQDRSQALRMVKENNGKVTAKGLSDLSDKSIKTARRLLDELTALGVLAKTKGTGTIANDYQISDKFNDFLLLDTTDFLSSYSKENSDSGNTTDFLSHKETDDISPEERAAKDAGLFDELKETEDTWTEMDPRI